jgi:acetyl-CoA C-acetyltransferase/potassium large conductance calcium-activated channel subfamily M alpha protein 1
MKDEEKQNLQLCLQLIKPESKYLYYKSLNMSAANDKLIIVEEIKMNLLAKSCFAPGLIACMSNLAASASTDDLELEEEWLNEYANGMGHEIYRMQISEANFSSPLQLTFRDIADLCFFEF